MPKDYRQTKSSVVSQLRELLIHALQDADRLQLDFVAIKISEAIDALDAAENGPNRSAH
jgi:hypothetical protein